MSQMVSPEHLVTEGIRLQLDGVQPETRNQQAMLMNFIAYNITPEVAPAACRLIADIYPQHFGLLTEQDITNIVTYQTDKRK